MAGRRAPFCVRCRRRDIAAGAATCSGSSGYVTEGLSIDGRAWVCRAEGGCAHDYDGADMQQARCMLCRRRGHFCCQSTARLPALKRSCYNCGDRNHTGEECWRVSPQCCSRPASSTF